MQATSQMCSGQSPRMISDDLDRSADYDVVIVGGAFSGASSAILLKRTLPDLRVLIIERAEVFDRKVGESTSEVAGCFLTRVLKVGMHLSRQHVAKHGLRLWFHKDTEDKPGSSTEIGPSFQVRVSTFQLNRVVLDAELLRQAVELGCEVVRPATIKKLELGGVGKNQVTYKGGDGEIHEVSAGWVIDASGKACLVAKLRKTWHSHTEAHPTSAMWTRFQDVCYLDSPEGEAQLEGASSGMVTQRGFATNHLMGYGWWCWIIPLDNGEVSAGLTWDQRIFTPPAGDSMSERVKKHLLQHPIGRVMFENATAVENDNRYYKGLAYYSDEVAGDGFTLVGDATGFMDPLYSQGLDFCAHTVYSSFALIRDYYTGDCECLETQVSTKNSEFTTSYFRWFESLYRDKYYYLGDAEIMRAAFFLDIGTYFVGPVKLVLINEEEFSRLPYHGPIGGLFARFMSFYNRRFVVLAHKKIAAGNYGNKNLDHDFLIPQSFTPGVPALKLLAKGIRFWLTIEARYLLTRAAPRAGKPTESNPLPPSR
ncbi:NAD(P)/FAD-dependent oxidoreductase [Verrucomicrobiaceae bacterium 227]